MAPQVPSPFILLFAAGLFAAVRPALTHGRQLLLASLPRGSFAKQNAKRGKSADKPTAPAADSDNHATLGSILVLIWAFYLVVFHTLSNMPLDQALLYGVQAR